MQRRDFLKCCGAACLGMAAGVSTRSASLSGTLSRPGMQLGHALRAGNFKGSAQMLKKTPVLIVGGGVAGLSAAYYLSKAGFHDYLLLEMAENIGGNTVGGKNQHTSYPWGAHYLPLPTRESMHVRDMLQDFGILLQGVDNEAPVYDERFMVHAPEERLFDGGIWQEGLYAAADLSASEKGERQRFMDSMAHFRNAYGADGLKAFAIPLSFSSADPQYRKLDRLTMNEWLTQNGFQGDKLRWYVNYCCRDDFGTGINKVSAWIGIHYFAARAGIGLHAEQGAYLTWPEGLGKLTSALLQRTTGGHMQGFVHQLSATTSGVRAMAYMPQTGTDCEILAQTVIWAAPAHLARHAIGNDLLSDRSMLEVDSAPWVVANLELQDWPKYRPQAPLSWDNVIRNGHGIGYVVATHQQIAQATHGPTVLTCYDPWSQNDNFAHNRQLLQQADWHSLSARFLNDLRAPHPDIDRLAVKMDIRIWGHAMASPARGFLSHPARNMARLDGKLLFAHADASGYSVFEEASWLGLVAAKKAIARS